MLRPAARFPDALIRLAPVAAYVIAEVAEELARLAIERAHHLGDLRGCMDDLAVTVELELIDCRVADPDRATVAIATQAAQPALARGMVAVDVVHHAQLRPRQPGRVKQPG